MANYTCSITIQNQTTYTFYDGASHAHWGKYNSRPVTFLAPGEMTQFQLADKAGAGGSEGTTTYSIDNPDKKGDHDKIHFHYQCGYAADNYLRCDCPDSSVKYDLYGQQYNWLTEIPPGQSGQYPAGGHPLSGIFIAAMNRVAAGSYCVGHSSDLSTITPLTPYWMPEKTDASDITGIGIAQTGVFYYWLRDGNVHTGTAGFCSSNHRDYKRNLPGRLQPEDIVGVAVNPVDDRCYFYYRDDTVSVGSSIEPERYVKPTKFKLPAGKDAAQIVGVGSHATNKFFFWFDDGTVCGGSYTDLTAFREPYKYVIPSGKSYSGIQALAIQSSGRNFVWF